MKRICVFCGSHVGNDGAYAQMAREAAQAIVAAGYGIVYGGGGVGLMTIVADAALESGGEVIGVIPHALARTEMAHQGLSELHLVTTMHERKALMEDLSDAFVALPGGFGTMDEFCEVLSWRQLRIHDKPIGLLNFRGYYDALLALFDSMVREGFVGPHTRGLFVDAPTIDELLSEMFLEKSLP
ncbi:MAG TPA: TIGR00730 family Rossman fold protein [Candidatus Cybelea sp.]|nr:TIGR00730 family Rossman fold protein [Candidatus Cybelea sp.]